MTNTATKLKRALCSMVVMLALMAGISAIPALSLIHIWFCFYSVAGKRRHAVQADPQRGKVVQGRRCGGRQQPGNPQGDQASVESEDKAVNIADTAV